MRVSQKKLHQARKADEARRTGFYKSGSPIGPGMKKAVIGRWTYYRLPDPR